MKYSKNFTVEGCTKIVIVKGVFRRREYPLKDGETITIAWKVRKHWWQIWLVKNAPKISVIHV